MGSEKGRKGEKKAGRRGIEKVREKRHRRDQGGRKRNRNPWQLKEEEEEEGSGREAGRECVYLWTTSRKRKRRTNKTVFR